MAPAEASIVFLSVAAGVLGFWRMESPKKAALLPAKVLLTTVTLVPKLEMPPLLLALLREKVEYRRASCLRTTRLPRLQRKVEAGRQLLRWCRAELVDEKQQPVFGGGSRSLIIAPSCTGSAHYGASRKGIQPFMVREPERFRISMMIMGIGRATNPTGSEHRCGACG